MGPKASGVIKIGICAEKVKGGRERKFEMKLTTIRLVCLAAALLFAFEGLCMLPAPLEISAKQIHGFSSANWTIREVMVSARDMFILQEHRKKQRLLLWANCLPGDDCEQGKLLINSDAAHSFPITEMLGGKKIDRIYGHSSRSLLLRMGINGGYVKLNTEDNKIECVNIHPRDMVKCFLDDNKVLLEDSPHGNIRYKIYCMRTDSTEVITIPNTNEKIAMYVSKPFGNNNFCLVTEQTIGPRKHFDLRLLSLQPLVSLYVVNLPFKNNFIAGISEVSEDGVAKISLLESPYISTVQIDMDSSMCEAPPVLKVNEDIDIPLRNNKIIVVSDYHAPWTTWLTDEADYYLYFLKNDGKWYTLDISRYISRDSNNVVRYEFCNDGKSVLLWQDCQKMPVWLITPDFPVE